jgi:hypothetical protein
MRNANLFLLSLFCAGALYTNAAYGAGAEDLAKAAQNPVANMISLPLQNNTNFDFGPNEQTQSILNIQPVWPISLNDKWNLITRTILPVMSQPGTLPGQDRTNGLGDITFTAFLSPKASGKLIWGVGPVALLPTATDEALGADQWGLGPSAPALRTSTCFPGSTSSTTTSPTHGKFVLRSRG